MDMNSFGALEHYVHTRHGSVSVAIFGDHEKPPLVAYPDVALNHEFGFQGLLFCPEASSLLLRNFCIYLINPPGHQVGAAPIPTSTPTSSAEDLAEQVSEVLDFFGLGEVMCLGITAGAYILTLFAAKYTDRVIGLIVVSPLCRAPSWTEWLCNKVLSNTLYFYGMCGFVKECLLQRYFSKEVRGSSQVPESDVVQACRRLLDEMEGTNVRRFLDAINERRNLLGALRDLRCRMLVFVGEDSPFQSDAYEMMDHLDQGSVLVEVRACGSLVTEEQPYAMLEALECFLTTSLELSSLRPSIIDYSPRSTLTTFCISPELLSPESMGVKLKPIKTRVS